MKALRGQRINVPKDLAEVSSIDRDAECDPRELGMAADAPQRIWETVEKFYRTGLQPGISLVIRRHGKVVLSRAIGHARGNGPDDDGRDAVAMQTDTPVCLFSASKAITAMLLHKQVERGALKLDDKVSDYLPEYAVHGKGETTLRHLLSHQAGIPRVPMKDPDPSILYDWEGAVRMLAGAKPVAASGQQQAYHAITAGYIIGEVIQRVSGTSLKQRLQEDFAEPLGCSDLSYGIASDRPYALNYFTGLKPIYPVSMIAKRALGIAFEKVSEVSNEPGFRNSVIPAGNIYASAEESCRFFQMLLDDGQWQGNSVMRPEIVQEAMRPAGKLRWDRTMLVPVRFSAGMVLGEKLFGLYGKRCPRAFGHLGFINIICWADPDRALSVALLNTGKTLAPDGLPSLARILWSISQNCALVNDS